MGSKSSIEQRQPNESREMYLARVTETKMAAERHRMLEAWDHKREGTPETWEHAARTNQGALARLYMEGHIDEDQLAWACEIGAVAEMIERDVEVRTTQWKMRVDCTGSARDALVEGIFKVQAEVAYTWWRQRIPEPRRAILDMLTGEPKAVSTIARSYRMGKKRARRLLVQAIDLWPEAMDYADGTVDKASLAAAHAAIL